MRVSSQELSQALTEEQNRLRGQLLGLIESFGLPDQQERGMKSTLKLISYQSQARLQEIIDEYSS